MAKKENEITIRSSVAEYLTYCVSVPAINQPPKGFLMMENQSWINEWEYMEYIMANNSELVIYITEDGLTKVDVTFDHDTVWLSLDQMAELFQRDKSTISRHIKNIFAEGELSRNSTVANFTTVQIEGSRSVERTIEFYNLDVIISVGY